MAALISNSGLDAWTQGRRPGERHIPNEIVKSQEEKTANELLPGSLKRSPSYNPKYGNKTRGELADLAKKGDQSAKKMKKLVDQVPRLLDKNKNK